MGPFDISKFVEELFQWEPHRMGALVTGLVLGFSASWALRRRSDAPLRKTIRSLEAELEKQTSENKRLNSELVVVQDGQLNQLHTCLDERNVPRGQREIMAWTSAGRRIPVCIHNRGKKTHRVIFPDGRDDTVSVAESHMTTALSPAPKRGQIGGSIANPNPTCVQCDRGVVFL